MHRSCAGEAPQLVAVPTHFYKVLLAETKAGGGGGLPLPSPGGPRRVVGAFVMPNQAIDPTTPLTAFAVPITALEEASGRCPLCFGAHLQPALCGREERCAPKWSSSPPPSR